jgi:hypothetical protein
MNDSGTNGKIDAPLTHLGSRTVLDQACRDLIVMGQLFGTDSAVAYHGFNLVELLQNDVLNGPVWGDHFLQQPSVLLKRQTDGLQRALAAGE